MTQLCSGRQLPPRWVARAIGSFAPHSGVSQKPLRNSPTHAFPRELVFSFGAIDCTARVSELHVLVGIESPAGVGNSDLLRMHGRESTEELLLVFVREAQVRFHLLPRPV